MRNNNIDDKTKEIIILEALSTAEGTKKLMNAMREPARCTGWDYPNEKYDKLYSSNKEKAFCLCNEEINIKLNNLNSLTNDEKKELLNDLKIRIKNLSFTIHNYILLNLEKIEKGLMFIFEQYSNKEYDCYFKDHDFDKEISVEISYENGCLPYVLYPAYEKILDKRFNEVEIDIEFVEESIGRK